MARKYKSLKEKMFQLDNATRYRYIYKRTKSKRILPKYRLDCFNGKCVYYPKRVKISQTKNIITIKDEMMKIVAMYPKSKWELTITSKGVSYE